MNPHVETSKRFLQALSTKDSRGVHGLVAGDFVYKPHPSRLKSFGKPEGLTARDFVDMINALDRIKKWTFDLQHPIKVVESGSTVVLHVSAQVEMISGETKETEYIYFFDFKEGKIAEINEFFDTVYVAEISS
ncbi:hypothetical protein JCM24511_09053 [Saitozyma sp. JCM 24511]|nr:hypothetical protein JCM24511_09053 [Saitozyma sp. JCM 24511]